MSALTLYAHLLAEAESHGASFDDVESILAALGPGDENAPETDEETCPICGGVLEECGEHDDRRCPDCGTTMTAPEDEYSYPPTDEDRKARLTWRDQA